MSRGSVTKRGDVWRIAVELEPDASGKRRQRFETFRGSKREADRRLTELLALRDQHRLGVTSKETVAEYLAVWLRDGCADLAPKTRDTYAMLARRYVEPHIGSVQLEKLTPSLVVGMLRKLRETNRANGQGEKLSPATIHAAFRMLRTAMNTAVKWRVIAVSPISGVNSPTIPRKEMQAFTAAQAQAFLAAAGQDGTKWAGFFTLALMAGCRPGELRALRWTDLDLEAGTFMIQRAAQRIVGVGIVIGPTKTAGSRRPVAIGPEVVAMLRRHRVEQVKERLAAGPLWTDQGLVFPSESGSVLESARIHRVFSRICERAGAPKVRVYDLRHSSATLLLAAGVNPRVVAERLGHASTSMTMNVYAHALPGMQADAATMLESLVRQAR